MWFLNLVLCTRNNILDPSQFSTELPGALNSTKLPSQLLLAQTCLGMWAFLFLLFSCVVMSRSGRLDRVQLTEIKTNAFQRMWFPTPLHHNIPVYQAGRGSRENATLTSQQQRLGTGTGGLWVIPSTLRGYWKHKPLNLLTSIRCFLTVFRKCGANLNVTKESKWMSFRLFF